MSTTQRPAKGKRKLTLLVGVMLVVSAFVALVAICTGSVGGMVVGGIMLGASLIWVFAPTHRTRQLMALVAIGTPVVAILWSLFS